MGTLVNLNLFYMLLAVSLTAFLGTVILLHDRKSATNKIFIVHSFVGVAWAIVNYFSIVGVSFLSPLVLIRLVLFFAVPHVVLFLLFVLNFPNSKLIINKKWFYLIVFVMTTLMLSVISPFVFSSVEIVGGSIVPKPGPLIFLFSPSLIFLFMTSVIAVFYKFFKSAEKIKKQWVAIGIGLLTAYFLLIFFVLLRVIIFNDTTFVFYSPLFILPIFFGAAYAIIRHQLFNVKVVATEILVFLLLVISFVQFLNSTSLVSSFLATVGILFTLIAGILLVRSVVREVKQREELQVLTKKLEEANDQLQALDKARAEFISIASHQLRTPPATIKWYVGAVMDGDFGPLTPDIKSALERVQSTNNSQISLIDDLLNASRIERGKLEFFFEMGDLSELAKTTYEQLLPQATMHKIKLVYEAPTKPLPQVMLDKEKVRQVINNFIDNAIKYSKVGQITVKIEQTPTDLVLKVSDTGRGIPQDVIPTLFEKYSRGKDSASAASGLGLGLYVAKVVIEQNQGKIWAESEGEGKGSTFAFSLPIHSNLQATSTVDLVGAQESHK